MVPPRVRLGGRLQLCRTSDQGGFGPQPDRLQHVLSPRCGAWHRRIPNRLRPGRHRPSGLRGDRVLYPPQAAVARPGVDSPATGEGRPSRPGRAGAAELPGASLLLRGALKGPGRAQPGQSGRSVDRVGLRVANAPPGGIARPRRICQGRGAGRLEAERRSDLWPASYRRRLLSRPAALLTRELESVAGRRLRPRCSCTPGPCNREAAAPDICGSLWECPRRSHASARAS